MKIINNKQFCEINIKIMGELKNEFAQALSYSKSATSGKEPSNQQKLIMYALFKQVED